MSADRISLRSARICVSCDNLVTTDSECPLCNTPTEVNPHIPKDKSESCYCTYCGNGPFKEARMHLVTWNEDPYTQMEDGDLTLKCNDCRKEEDQ